MYKRQLRTKLPLFIIFLCFFILVGGIMVVIFAVTAGITLLGIECLEINKLLHSKPAKWQLFSVVTYTIGAIAMIVGPIVVADKFINAYIGLLFR